MGRAPSLEQDRRLALALTGAGSLLAAIAATGYLPPHGPLGADASSHVAIVGSLAERLRAGEGWWCPEFDAGFPIGLYYPPIPHTVSALVCAALGGADHAVGVHKLLSALMIVLQPWAIYAGARRAGLAPLAAGAAGGLAPLVINGLGFGYNAMASLGIGLYAQCWANVALPLAVGELVALLGPRAHVPRAIFACAALAGCHLFYAVAIVPAVCALALFSADRGGAARRLAVTGACALAILSPWLVPLAANQTFFGGWPFGRAERVIGYGWATMTGTLLRGRLLDGDSWPVLTPLAVVGLIVVARRLRGGGGASRAIALLFLTGLLGAVGRAGLGALVDLYPLHRGLQHFRYVVIEQFAALLAAGVGVSFLAAQVARRFDRPPFGRLVVVAVFLAALPAGLAQLRDGFRVLSDSDELHLDDYYEAAGWLRDAPGAGRVYVGPFTGLPGHYHTALLAHLAGKPTGQSAGGGLQDSMNFYPLQYVIPEHPSFAALAALYDFRWILARFSADRPPPPGRVVARNETYVLTELASQATPVGIYRVGNRRTGTPRESRGAILEWLNGNGPSTATTEVLTIPSARSRTALTGKPPLSRRRTQFAFEGPPRGEVLSSRAAGATFAAEVRLDEPAVVAAKLGYHPFWRVRVNGDERETVFAFPGFLGVELEAGTWEIEGEFRWPAYSRWLWLLTACAAAAALAWPAISRAGRSSAAR